VPDSHRHEEAGSRGGPHAPACYEVRWYTRRKIDPDSPPASTRVRIVKWAGSIEHRLQELTDEDRAKLEQCDRSLPPAERRDSEERVMGRTCSRAFLCVRAA
jgi:hypothetical protein